MLGVWLLWAGVVPAAAAEDSAAERVDTPLPMVVRHYSSTEGLPVSSAADAAVDAEGFLWLATHDGLARFDGREFTVYDAARVPDMGSNRIWALFAEGRASLYAVGSNGELLRVAAQGIRRIVPDGERIDTRVRYTHTEPLCFTFTQGMHCAVQGQLHRRRSWSANEDVRVAVPHGAADWLLRGDGQVLRCEADRCVTQVNDRPLRFRSDELVHAALQGDALLLGLPKLGLLRVRSDAPAQWLMQPDAAGELDLLQLREEADGSVMVATSTGLYRVRDVAVTALQPVAATASARYAQVRSWRAPDGALWHAEDGRLYRERRLALQTQGAVTGLVFGEDGIAFVTTLRDGMYVIAPPRVRLLDGDPRLTAGNVYGMALGEDGSAWLGTLGAGLLQRHADGRVERHDRAAGLPGDNIWAVWVEGATVYAASYMPGLWVRPAGSKQFEAAPVPPVLASARILAFARSPTGTLWVGGSEGAWERIAGHQWVRRWPLEGAGRVVRCLAFGPDHTVWLGGDEGLWRLQDQKEEPVAAAWLDGVEVRGLTLTQDQSLWVSTAGRGLLRVAADDPAGLRAVRLGRAEGLPSNSPHVVLEDPARPGDLWVNSNQGIYRISGVGLAEWLAGASTVLSPLTLGLADGLTELEGNGGVQPAAAVDAEGRIWLASQRGVVQVDPTALPLRRQPPRAVIDNVLGAGGALPDPRALPLGERALQVHYNAADLYAGRAVRFRYRLTPGDAHWTEAGERRVAAYAALPPGIHTFEVLAGNSDGFWATQPATWTFSVPAYAYETRVFQAAASALAVLAMLGLVHWRLRRTWRLARVLDLQVQRRTLELRSEKLRVESTLNELGEAHRRLALTHAEIADRNRRLAEQASRLESLDRFRTRLLADVSHELRTPLMLIRLPLQGLVDGCGDLPEAQREQLRLPLTQTSRLAHLVEQLVGLVQAEAGQLPLRMRRLQPELHLRTVLDSFQPVAAQVQVGLIWQAPAALPMVYADPDHLTTVLSNLLDNALKYAPTGSTVQVQLDESPAGEALRVRVIDGGPGFPAGQAEALFERFHREQGPPRQGREGLGIGLALARELIELHGGRIGARMEPHWGTVFWFELPTGSAHVELADLALHTPPPTLDVPPAQPGGILLVEDHPELAAYLAERLGEWHPVQVESSAEAAWTTLQHIPFAMLICDVVLPGMDGMQLCRHIRQHPRLQDLPVLLMSAKTTAADRAAAFAAGANHWLGKPFTFADLLHTVLQNPPASAIATTQATVPGRTALPAATPAPSNLPALATHPAPTVSDPMLNLALERLGDADFGVAEWAAVAYLSDRQLRRRVSELTGLSPLHWLREQRLLRVRALISSGECQTLAAAGAQAGIDNPTYLYRLYRARFGED